MGTGSIHESYAAVLISRSCTGVAVGFCMPAAQIYVSIFRLRQAILSKFIFSLKSSVSNLSPKLGLYGAAVRPNV